MRLRQANKIMKNVESGRYTDEQIGRAGRRWERTRDAKAAYALWHEVAPELRRQMFPPMTPEEALRIYANTVPVELSEERIREIVDYCLSAPE